MEDNKQKTNNQRRKITDRRLMKKILTKSAEETKKLAQKIAKKLENGAILALIGELGAGKTCFVQGLAEGLKTDKKCYVSSPTFTILKIYPGKIPLNHFDFYRLNNFDEFEDLGFEDYLKNNGITAIEWADKFLDKLPQNVICIEFAVIGENERSIKIPKGLLF